MAPTSPLRGGGTDRYLHGLRPAAPGRGALGKGGPFGSHAVRRAVAESPHACEAPELPLQMAPQVPFVRLGPGSVAATGISNTTPTIIVGCRQLQAALPRDALVPTAIEEVRLHSTLAEAARLGACAFDCSDSHPDAEAMLGRFIVSSSCLEAQASCGLQPRVHVELVPDVDGAPCDSHYVEAVLRRASRRLRLSPGRRLDVVYLRWLDSAQTGYVEAAQLLATFLQGRSPLIRTLGVENFGEDALIRILEAGVPVSVVKVQLSLLNQKVAAPGSILDICARCGISVVCDDVLAGGLLSDDCLGLPEQALSETRRADLSGCDWDALQGLLKMLKSLADARSASIASIAAAWVLRQRGVSACLLEAPGDGSPALLIDLACAAVVELSADDMAEIGAAVRRLRRDMKLDTRRLLEQSDSARICAEDAMRPSQEEAHAEEILAAWASPTDRISGGQAWAGHLHCEARYCLASHKLSTETAARLTGVLPHIKAVASEAAASSPRRPRVSLSKQSPQSRGSPTSGSLSSAPMSPEVVSGRRLSPHGSPGSPHRSPHHLVRSLQSPASVRVPVLQAAK